VKALCQELESILEAKIEIAETEHGNTRADQTLIQTSSGIGLLIHRSLNELETTFVKKWIEKALNQELNSGARLLLDQNGYKEYIKPLRFPIKLWRIQFKDNHEEVHQILYSTFKTNKIINLSPQESVVFVTKNELTPYDLLGMLESEALTSAKIITGNAIYHASEFYAGYFQLVELSELTQMLNQNAQVITYESLLFPMIVKQLKNANGIADISKGNLFEAVMKHHIKPVEDPEIEHTALIFFENNLNITETANKLFIHRNTLIYRLNKLESITGYDIRKFNDAINYYLSYLADKIK